jgi:YidC/Oxa1 family membrane protein insertase
MLVQTKLFSPPPTTPEAEQQQKMMKYMMIFMAFMFYKVPSGLGLYFITSSLWQIGERLLLPKVLPSTPKPALEAEEIAGERKGSSGPGPNGGGNGNGGAQGWLSKRLEKLLEEAAKDKTIRNADPASRERERERNQDRDRDRDRTRPKPKPGKRR